MSDSTKIQQPFRQTEGLFFYHNIAPFLFRQERCPKEAAIGEALMPRCRATNAPSPMYPTRAQRKNCITLSRRDGTSSQSCSWRRLRSRRPAVLVSTAGNGAGGFLRAVRRAANQNRSLAGGKRTLVSTRVERELGLAPLSRLLLVLFLPKQEKYGTTINSGYQNKHMPNIKSPPFCGRTFSLSDEAHGQGGGPAFAGIQDRSGGLFLPLAAAALGRRQAVPGLDAYELGHTGLAPQ